MNTGVGTLTCTFCGFESPGAARFCSNCGRDLSTLTCTFCGFESLGAARFCSNCGREVSGIEYAGFWIRLGAYLIDAAIHLVVYGVFWVLLGSVVGPVVYLPVAIAYYVWFWAVKGATPGKMVVGIEVLTADGEGDGIGFGKAGLRYIGYMVSSIILGIGFLMIAFTREKKGLHDYIAGTVVVRS